jgi:general stress protein 26
MDDLKEFTVDLMKKTPVLYLATVDHDGLPQVRAMENLRCVEKFPHPAKVISENELDPLTTYISTNTNSKKIKQKLVGAKVALYYCLPGEYKGVMIRGEAELYNDLEFKNKLWMDYWTMYYPEGVSDPDFTLIKVKPEWIKAWYKGIHETWV